MIINTADEGVAVVIQDVEDYFKEAKRQLNDKEYFKMLDSGPTKTLVDQTID